MNDLAPPADGGVQSEPDPVKVQVRVEGFLESFREEVARREEAAAVEARHEEAAVGAGAGGGAPPGRSREHPLRLPLLYARPVSEYVPGFWSGCHPELFPMGEVDIPIDFWPQGSFKGFKSAEHTTSTCGTGRTV